MIEEEREEDEKKLNIAIAAAERMNVLVRQTTLKELIIKYLKGSSHLSLCNWQTELELKITEYKPKSSETHHKVLLDFISWLYNCVSTGGAVCRHAEGPSSAE